MAFKFIAFAACLACASAGNLYGAPAVAHYSAAPAVSSSYIHQASPVAVGHVGLAHAAPVAYAQAAPVAYAQAAPVAYAQAAPVAIHAPAYGSSQQSVVRSLGGAQAVSHYAKAVDSAFSSVRKYDTRITNDALSVAHAPVLSSYAHASPVVSAYGHAAPVVSSYSHAAPVVSAYGHAAPVVSAYGHGSPVVSAYGASPLLTKTVAPVASYAHASPLAYSAGPAVVTKSAAVAYSPASVVSHMTFSGYGVNYGW